jgi:hypothetical protein
MIMDWSMRTFAPAQRAAAFAAVQLSLLLVLTAGHEVNGVNNETGDVLLSSTFTSASNRVEGVVLCFFFWLIGFVAAMIGALLASFAHHENKLLHQYKWQGVRVKANVWNTEFVRMLRQTKACSSCHTCDPNHSQLDGANLELLDHEEYIAIIEYRLSSEMLERDNGKEEEGLPYEECPPSTVSCLNPFSPIDDCVVVRKQVKACRSEFSVVGAKSEAADAGDIHRILVDFQASPALGAEPTMAVESDPSLLHLYVLVVPGHKNSGMSQQHVERMCSVSYRLPTVVMCLGLIVLNVLCSFLGVRSFFTITNQGERMATAAQSGTDCLLIGTLIISGINLLSTAALSICVASSWIKQSLRAEYLDGGDDVLPPSLGDSYSISSGDDAYLMF